MVFKYGDKLTWKKFLEADKEIQASVKKQQLNEETSTMPKGFATMEEALAFARQRGAVPFDEYLNEIREKYGM